MERSAWIRRIGPGVVALMAVGLLTSTTLGASDRRGVPPACRGVDRPVDLVSRPDRDVTPSRAADSTWFQLDAVLDADGALVGQRLVAGRGRDGPLRTLDMDREAFAAGPFGTTIVAGTDDGSSSRLLALDVVDGCVRTVDTSTDIIRRATVAPDGRSVLEFRLDRRTRVDLGLWVRPLDRLGEATRVIAPIDADARFGRTWSTELAWSSDGTELAIESCGEIACRTRLFAPATGRLRLVDGPDLGPSIGLADGRLVAYLACPGLPCPLVAVTVADGTRRILSPDAGPAGLVATGSGPRLILQRPTKTGWGLSSMTLDGALDRDLGDVPDGLDLAMGSAWSSTGMNIPDGWVLLAPGGRRSPSDRGPAPLLRHVLDGRTTVLDEVIP